MKPYWVDKTDPEHYPVRYLASLWQQGQARNFRVAAPPLLPKQWGQLKSLRELLGDLALHVVTWMLKPENWYAFAQQVGVERRFFRVPDYPDIGFLLEHRNVALKVIRWKLRESTDEQDVIFCRRLDQIRFEQFKSLTLVCAHGAPEMLGKIAAAKTLTDVQRVFIEIVDENVGRKRLQQDLDKSSCCITQ